MNEEWANHLQVPSNSLLPFGLGRSQLFTQHFLPHVDGLQRLLQVKQVLLQQRNATWVS